MQQELCERLLASDDPKVVAYYITEGYALSYTKRITLKVAFKLEMYLDSLMCKKP